MSVLSQDQTNALEAQLTPLTVGEDTYLLKAHLHEEVATLLFPNGVQTDADYDQVVIQATKFANHRGYAGEITLRPPQVAFGQAGIYLRKQPPLCSHLVSPDFLGQPFTDAYKPIAYYPVQTVCNEIARELHGTSRLSSDVLNLLEEQIETAMVAQGWQRSQGARPRYEKPLVPNLDGLHASLLAWLQTRHQAVYHSDLMRQATTYVYSRAYDVPHTAHPDYRQLFQPILDALPAALRAAKFETTHTSGIYNPQPLEISAEMPTQLSAALNALSPIPSKHGDVLNYDLVWKAIAVLFDMRHTQFTTTQTRQVETTLLNDWLQRHRYQLKSRYVRGRDCAPRQHDGFRAYFPVCQVVQDTNHQIALGSGNGKAFPVHAPLCIIDEKRNAIVCLQLIGNPQAVKANWARLMTAYQTPVEIDGIYIRQRGMKQHLVLKKPLPLDQAEWVLLHKQASYEAMQPDEPFYVLDNGTDEIPTAFFPMLDAALAIPLQPHWATYFWQQGLALNLIRPVNDRSYGKMAWHVNTATETWEQIIHDGFQSGALVLLLNGKPIETPDALEIISTYTTDDAVDDGLLYDVEDIEAVFKEAELEDLLTDVPALIVPTETAFPLGRIVTTPGALELAQQGVDISASLRRHAAGDWGELDTHDRRANDHALKQNDGRLFSSYEHNLITESGERTVKLWIITEWDRSVTTLLRPDEY